MKLEEKIIEKVRDYNGNIKLIYDSNYGIGTKAQAALDLSKQMALAMCEHDGESSSGQQKLALMHPERIASRACDIVKYLFQEFERREWLIEAPELPKPRVEPDSLSNKLSSKAEL